MTRSQDITLAVLSAATFALAFSASAQGVSPDPCPDKIADECPTPVGAPAPPELEAAPTVSDVLACLVVPSETNPFYARLRAGAEQRAADLGLGLRTFAAPAEGDTESQVAAIEACIAEGAKGILLAAGGDPADLQRAVQSARDAGLFVVGLEDPFFPTDVVNTTIATDGVRSGFHLGAWTAAALGDSVREAEIGMIDFGQSNPLWMTTRNQGFLHALDIELAAPTISGDETDPRIIAREGTFGLWDDADDAVAGVLARAPEISVIYLPSTVALQGATDAMAGKSSRPLVVAAQGSCDDLTYVANGLLGAMMLPAPERTGSLGIDAVAWFAFDGRVFNPGTFFDAGAWLVTDRPVDGLNSVTVEEARAICGG
jgi:fructose transport system substrate-binding protein